MTQEARVRDCKGRIVRLGDRVRYLTAEGGWFERLPEAEKVRILEMVGKEFVITEIDEYGAPWIEAEWEDEPGEYESHHISLESHEMELVAGATLRSQAENE